MQPAYTGMNGIILYCESYASKGEGSQEKPGCLRKKAIQGATKFAHLLVRARETYNLIDVPLLLTFKLPLDCLPSFQVFGYVLR